MRVDVVPVREAVERVNDYIDGSIGGVLKHDDFIRNSSLVLLPDRRPTREHVKLFDCLRVELDQIGYMRLRPRCKRFYIDVRARLFLDVRRRAPVKALFLRRFELVV